MRRLFAWLMVLSVPLLIALNVGRSGRYQAEVERLDRLEADQQVWLDNNKRLIAATAGREAPARVDEAARDELGMRRARADEVLRVELGAGNGDASGQQ